jgi:hypothetical protein
MDTLRGFYIFTVYTDTRLLRLFFHISMLQSYTEFLAKEIARAELFAVLPV